MTKGDQVDWEQGDTWPKILKTNNEIYGDRVVALRQKHYGLWQAYTWKDYYRQVKSLAWGLLSLGLNPGDRVLIIGDNAPQWYYAELAVQAVQGIAVGLISELLPQEILYAAKNAEVRYAFVENQEQVDKILQVTEELPLLQRIIYWNNKGLAHYKNPLLMGFRQLNQSGEAFGKEHPGLFEEKLETGKAEGACVIVYTAGTTGINPKGVMHTYQSMRAGVDQFLRSDPWTEKDTVVPYQPPAGIMENYLTIGCHLLSGCSLNFPESTETQLRDMREARPTIVCYHARLWESQAAMLQGRMQDADVLQQAVYRRFMADALDAADRKKSKDRSGLFEKIRRLVGRKILFDSLKHSLGLSRARICYSTGAILSPEAYRFFGGLGIPIKNVYGTSEGGVLAIGRNDDRESEGAGPVLPGVEVRLTDQGEIVSRQRGTFSGYYNNPDRTDEVLREGWLYSGDRGSLQPDGRLVFLDRMADVLNLNNGRILSPQKLESRLRFSPFIKDAWVSAGPEGTFLTAVIIIHNHTVSRWAGHKKIPFATFAELSQHPEVYRLIIGEVERINRKLSPETRVKKIVLLPKEFDPEEGSRTRSGNLKRHFLAETYQTLIQAVYQEKTEVPVDTQITHRDGRMEIMRTTLVVKDVGGEV